MARQTKEEKALADAQAALEKTREALAKADNDADKVKAEAAVKDAEAKVAEAQAAVDAAAQPAKSRKPILRITAKRDGFRRAGRAHPAEPTEYVDGDWTAKELAALKAEPMLVVQEL